MGLAWLTRRLVIELRVGQQLVATVPGSGVSLAMDINLGFNFGKLRVGTAIETRMFYFTTVRC